MGAARAGAGPFVTSGSHVDTVPDGGRYDGALGTVLALELAHELATPALGGVLVCAAEEAPRFGAGTIGSRLLVGTLRPSALDDLRRRRGHERGEARDELPARRSPTSRACDPPLLALRAHAEVHVAQRRALRELGVVTRRRVAPPPADRRSTGESGHSGEVSMDDRRDALAAAAEVDARGRGRRPRRAAETVATVGTLEVTPGAVSVIPGRARLAIDARRDRRGVAGPRRRRDPCRRRRDRHGDAPSTSRSSSSAAATPWSSTAASWTRRCTPPQPAASPRRRRGRASGHDAQHLAALFGTLLVFVPLQGGESHTPDEGADASDIEHASLVVSDVLSVVSRSN